jgi:hypothetical protein
MTRCYCEDFLGDGGARGDVGSGEEEGRPCKHILAACYHHAEWHKQLEPFVFELNQRNQLAAFLRAHDAA